MLDITYSLSLAIIIKRYFSEAYVPFLQKYNPNIVDGTGKSLEDLKGIIDQGQPVLIYHTNLGSKPLLRVFRFDNKPAKQVSNIHVTLLIGYDDYYYYYIDPLWSHIRRGLVLPAIIPNRKQIIKIRKEKMEYSFNSPGRNAFMCNHIHIQLKISNKINTRK